MEEIFGQIDTIVFSEEENGFVVARIKEPKKKELTTIVGTLPGAQIGENIRCKGQWRYHAKHGTQFEVHLFETQAPSDITGIQKYLESGMIKGIGPSYAKRIVDKFGTQTLLILDKDPGKLLSVPGIGEKRISMILKCWEEQHLIRSVMIFLRGHEVSPSFAQKIFKTYGEKSIEIVQENPYRLAKEVFGIGFKSADKIAQNIGMEKTASQRIASGLQHVLWEISNEGHVCLPKNELFPLAENILEVKMDIISTELDLLIKKGEIVQENEMLWIKPLYLTEVGISRELKRIIEAPCSIREIHKEKALEWLETKLKISLALEQKQAIKKAFCEKVLILTGGPGTGKSTITNGILKIYEKLTSKILLTAPTGRAAKRMSEITRRRAFTIHSLLEMDFTKGGFKKGKENPLQCDLIIIDEASMIDTLLMNHLLKAIPSHARVIFVGDIDQLPSVGPGNVLRDVIDSKKVPVVRLKEIFRQAKGSHIVINAHRINKGEFPWLKGEKDFQFIEADLPEKIQQILVDLISSTIPQKYSFDPFEDIQILCPMKRGPIGFEMLNQIFQNALNPSLHPLLRMGKRFHEKDKVMQIRNNYQKEVFNGDVGTILSIDIEKQNLIVLFDGREIPYEFSELDELVLAYAVSIHKFQGSECPCVIIPMHTSHFKLLHRNLLYTGITRGKKLVILVGSKKAIAIAVRNEEVQKRYTGLKKQLEVFLN